MCSPFEVLKPSEPCCEPTCDDDCLHAICRRAPDAMAVPTCVCRQGYVRHHGSCIRKEFCPTPKTPLASYDVYRQRPTPRPNALKMCGPNEQVTHCKPACVATCEKDCSAVRQPEVCVSETSCVCKDSFVRHNGRCIKSNECPRRHPLLTRPISGEYVDFEMVSLEGLKSDEDFKYKATADQRMLKQNYLTQDQARRPVLPLYIQAATATSKPVAASYESYTTERPALYPPLCACNRGRQMQASLQAPLMEENSSYESTEEESDIVPYAPPPCVAAYSQTPSMPVFPLTTPAPAVAYVMPRRTLAAPPVHRCDFNEPLDHFCGSGQAASSQQNSAAQDEPRKPPTIWPPVSSYCTRCGFKRKEPCKNHAPR
ncbi:uncharacterized protein LOC128724612 [Anopheles nili]|uniref:uncharacterized protein LOC128724612 n=1 Tax=Anopheles nili TaxID=185578 RepID=UPI00237BA305|nr:uncharacterized protein LOC128724612 [Anopheles nili]